MKTLAIDTHKELNNIAESTREIYRNGLICESRHGFMALGKEDRSKVLMELRHDLEDALKSVELLESEL